MAGDVLAVIRGHGARTHYGIDLGHWMVAHVEWGRNTEVVPLNVFSRGFPVYVWRLAEPREAHQIVTRALSQLGSPYNVATFNCETLVSYAVTGEFKSWSVEGFVAVGLLALGYLAATSALTDAPRLRRARSLRRRRQQLPGW